MQQNKISTLIGNINVRILFCCISVTRAGFTLTRALFKKMWGPYNNRPTATYYSSKYIFVARLTHKVVISLTIDKIRLLWRSSEPPPHQLGGLGEHCKLPQRGSGRSPDRKRILISFHLSLIKQVDKTQPYNRAKLVNVFKEHSVDIVSVISFES